MAYGLMGQIKKVFDPDLILNPGKVCMDVGASTGGFTDCLLRGGARKVYAVDVGYGQLDMKLRRDERVVCMDRTNIRSLEKDAVPDEIELAVIDVSFISLSKVLSPLTKFLRDGAVVVALVKPQFELPKEDVGEGGIVAASSLREKAVESVLAFARSFGYSYLGRTNSPISGAKGNREFFIHLRK